MNTDPPKLVVFTDLDGCLLNKSDYDWSAAEPVLRKLSQLSIPVVLNSSKTAAEMTELATDLRIDGTPFISENGGVIRWNDLSTDICDSIEQIVGIPRGQILSILGSLNTRFRFRTFSDLGIRGVVEHTGLSEEKAARARDRQSTEPLLWDDTAANLVTFQKTLSQHDLTLTKGGRFWHVAGSNTKGLAMEQVVKRYRKTYYPRLIVSAAIGDSPIDQSMLNVADYPIGIPDGASLNVYVDNSRGIVATKEGSLGWAEAVTKLLQRLDYTHSDNLRVSD